MCNFTNNFNKSHEVFHHFCSEMQTVKVIKCQILNEAKNLIVTPNLTKQKKREETSPNPDVKKVIHTSCCCFFFSKLNLDLIT